MADVTALEAFYASPLGILAAHLLRRRVQHLLPDFGRGVILGMGYLPPLAPLLPAEAERLILVAPPAIGPYRLRTARGNATLMADEADLPLTDRSVDLAILLHAVEFAPSPRDLMRSLWRVLRAEAQVLLIAPNRTGLWALRDGLPFGQGQPFTMGQLARLSGAAALHPERQDRALHLPPWTWASGRAGPGLDRGLRRVLPMLGGLNLLLVRKTVAGGTPVLVASALFRPVPATVIAMPERAGASGAPSAQPRIRSAAAQ